MPPFAKRYIILTGAMAFVGALLHLAIMMGGPDWYAFFGAPQGLVQMARNGSMRAPISCMLIAGILFVFAAYAVSGARLTRPLPLLRPVSALVAIVLTLRGLLFIPIILWQPDTLSRLCDCREVDGFIIITSLICLMMGIGYGISALFNGNKQ